jgi:hypothetical protein
MIKTHNSKTIMEHYILLGGQGQFRQCTDDDVQQCHFAHEYENKLTDGEYK